MNLDKQMFLCIAKIHIINLIGQVSLKLRIMTTVIDHPHINLKAKVILRRSNLTKLKELILTYKFGRMHHLHI